MSLRAKRNAGSEVPAFAIQGLLHPLDVARGCGNELEFANLKRDQFHGGDGPRRLDVNKIHQDKIIPILFITPDAFIVVQKVAATVENEPVTINFDGFRMMR